MTKELTLDFLNLQFPEVFLRFFGRGSLLSILLKCLIIGIIAWAPGLLASYFSGTLSMYISDGVHFAFDIGVGISLFLIVFLCRRINPTIQEVDNLVQHSTEKDFLKFVRDWNNSSSYWYYFCALGPPLYYVVQDLLHIFVPIFPHGPYAQWVDESIVSWEIVRLNTPYVIFEHVVTGLMIGIGFNRLLHYLIFIKDYGRKFLYKKNLDVIFQNVAAGLRPLGRLALESSLVITVPLCLVSICFFEHVRVKQCVSYTWLFSLIGIVIVLMLTVFLQVRYPRRVLLNAKRDSISFIDNRILELRTEIANDISVLSTLGDLFTLREHLYKTSTWIFNAGLISRFVLTIFLPIVGGAVIQIILERLVFS